MTDYEITIKSGSAGSFCNITEQRTRTITIDETKEKIEQPIGPHSSATALGNFAILDESGEIIGYREDDYKADVSARIIALLGPDAADLLASVALESAKVETARSDFEAASTMIREQMAATGRQLVADRDAMILDIDARQKAALQSVVDKHDEVTRAIAAQKADLDAAVAAAQDILARAAKVVADDAAAVALDAAESVIP